MPVYPLLIFPFPSPLVTTRLFSVSVSLFLFCYIHCCCQVALVVSDSVRPHRQKPTRLPCPWDSLGKNTGVGCHFLLQHMKVKSESEVAQSYPTLSDPMDCSLPGSSVHGIFQARILEWGCHCLLRLYSLVCCNFYIPHIIDIIWHFFSHYLISLNIIASSLSMLLKVAKFHSVFMAEYFIV